MASTLAWALFAVGAAAGLANLAGVWASVAGIASYYPLGSRDWRFYAFWGLSHVLNGTLVGLGYLQWRALGLPAWTVPVGAALLVVGFAVALAATRDLGVETTQGLRGGLRTDGWYRYSRNPQYVGYLVATVGYALFVAAPLAVALCGLYAALWVSFPRAEEPWLRERFGEEYDRYAASVPRYVGVRTVRTLRDRLTGGES